MAQLYVFEDSSFFLERTQVTQTDDHGGFHGDGIATITAHIPPDASEEFAQKLRDDGFKETPLSDFAQQSLLDIRKLKYVGQVTNGLWLFWDDSPEETSNGECTDFRIEIYDLDACIYYSIGYDS
ncbi:hypothetical protein [uncultured Oscillibacter sp.]|uniref:hypothetical protein n=1 Tax=uncultured Oscillibacter sp. TaxID=876091 RepID=UPI0025D3C14B|nr:hypothetical protein [uncultured Oscillibacter sp.]